MRACEHCEHVSMRALNQAAAPPGACPIASTTAPTACGVASSASAADAHLNVIDPLTRLNTGTRDGGTFAFYAPRRSLSSFSSLSRCAAERGGHGACCSLKRTLASQLRRDVMAR